MTSLYWCWRSPSRSTSWNNPSACPCSPASPSGTTAGWQDGGRSNPVRHSSASPGCGITGIWGWASKPRGESERESELRKGGRGACLRANPWTRETQGGPTSASSKLPRKHPPAPAKAQCWDARCGHPWVWSSLASQHTTVLLAALNTTPPACQELSALVSLISLIHACMLSTWFLQAFKTPALA